MTASDERLRAAFRERPEPAGQVDDEVSADEMWAVAAGELTGADARAILERIVASPASVAAWQITRELVAEAGLEPAYDEVPDVEPTWRPARRAPRRPWWPWAAWGGAALAAAVAVFLVLAPRSTSHLDGGGSTHLRSGGDHEIESALGADAHLARDAFELRWSGAPNGAVFEVHVTTDALVPVADAFDLAESHYTVSAEELARVPAGARLLWRVVAVTGDGERIESASFAVQLE